MQRRQRIGQGHHPPRHRLRRVEPHAEQLPKIRQLHTVAPDDLRVLLAPAALARFTQLAHNPAGLGLQRSVDRGQRNRLRCAHGQPLCAHGKADAAAARTHQRVAHDGIAQPQLALRLGMAENRGCKECGRGRLQNVRLPIYS